MLVSSIENIPDGLTGLKDRFFCSRGDWQLFLDLPWSDNSLISMTYRLLSGSFMNTAFLKTQTFEKK